MNISEFFREKVLIVTGSVRGIGREMARQALSAGAKVVINGRNAETLHSTWLDLGASEQVLPVCADVSHPQEAERLVRETLERWGRIDLLINNAGLSMRGAFSQLSNSTVTTMVEANFLSAVWMTRASLASLRASKGTILFVSSLAAVRGFPAVSLYSASKMALTAIHQSLRSEERRRGVRSCIAYLSFTENDKDKTTIGPDGLPFHHERPWSMTQLKTASSLLRVVALGRKRTFLTAAGQGLFWGQAFLPGVVDWFVERSGGTIHSVRRN